MLTRSNDRKVTNSVSPNGKTSRIANAFGLPSGTQFSCPGATSVCSAICYAGKLEKIYSGVKNVLVANWDQVKDADFSTLVRLIDEMIVDFIADCNKRGAEKLFRIHWDGDFFSVEYARAWAQVVRHNPDVQFWVYTRSFTPTINVIPEIVGLDNLSVYLSVDADNISHAVSVRKDFPSVLWAWLGNTMTEGKNDIAAAGSVKSYSCPEIRGSLPLISEKGSACVRCGICVAGRGDVVFSKKKGIS